MLSKATILTQFFFTISALTTFKLEVRLKFRSKIMAVNIITLLSRAGCHPSVGLPAFLRPDVHHVVHVPDDGV